MATARCRTERDAVEQSTEQRFAFRAITNTCEQVNAIPHGGIRAAHDCLADGALLSNRGMARAEQNKHVAYTDVACAGGAQRWEHGYASMNATDTGGNTLGPAEGAWDQQQTDGEAPPASLEPGCPAGEQACSIDESNGHDHAGEGQDCHSDGEDGYQGPIEDYTEVDITAELKPDQVLAWMIHGLTNAQKNKIFTGMKVMTQMTARSIGCNPPAQVSQAAPVVRTRQYVSVNPMALSNIGTTKAYEKHMELQARYTFSNYELVYVPVCSGRSSSDESESSPMTGMPAIPVYMRRLDDALSCAFAVSSIPPGGFHLLPQPPENSHHGQPPEEDRVQMPMQGRMAHRAHQARFYVAPDNAFPKHAYANPRAERSGCRIDPIPDLIEKWQIRKLESPDRCTNLGDAMQAKTEARERSGLSMLNSAWPLVFLALFYDKSQLSDSGSKCVPGGLWIHG